MVRILLLFLDTNPGVLHLFFPHRYLDNVVNRQSVSPPIPHLHALLTSGDDPPLEIDIFELIRTSYEVRFWLSFFPKRFLCADI